MWNDISFVTRSKNRKRVLKALEEPRTPTQLSKELELNVGYISNIIIELLQRKLITCLSPDEKRHRFYQITKRGNEVLKEIEKLS